VAQATPSPSPMPWRRSMSKQDTLAALEWRAQGHTGLPPESTPAPTPVPTPIADKPPVPRALLVADTMPLEHPQLPPDIDPPHAPDGEPYATLNDYNHLWRGEPPEGYSWKTWRAQVTQVESRRRSHSTSPKKDRQMTIYVYPRRGTYGTKVPIIRH
jgi:hypothetical protein